jgi:hypothetical protein
MRLSLLVALLFFVPGLYAQTFTVNSTGTSNQLVRHTILTTDGGSIVATNEPDSTAYARNVLIKLNSAGEQQWSKGYGAGGYKLPYTFLAPSGDNGFFAASRMDSANKYQAGITLFRGDSMGNILWQRKILPPLTSTYIVSGPVLASKDGGVFMLSYSATQYTLSKFDKDGALVWLTNFYKEDADDYGSQWNAFTETSNGDIAVAISTIGCDYYCSYLSLSFFKANGNPQYAYAMGDDIYSNFQPVQLMAPGENGELYMLLNASMGFSAYHYGVVKIVPDERPKVYVIEDNIFSLQKFLKNNSFDFVKGKTFPQADFYYQAVSIRNDWSLVKYSEYNENFIGHIKVESFDNAGRICPAFNLPKTTDTLPGERFPFSRYSFHRVNAPSFGISDLNLTVKDEGRTARVCYGNAPGNNMIAKQDWQSVVSTIPKKISIYPNPATNAFTISVESNKAQKALITIVDASGRSLRSFSIDLQKGINTWQYDISSQKKGLFFLRIQTDDGNEVIKLVKQ